MASSEHEPNRYEYDGYGHEYDGYGALSHEIALLKQRITHLERQVEHLESLIKVLEPGTPYSSLLVRGHDGSVVATISVMPDAGVLIATPLVPLVRGPPLDSFLVRYFEERAKDGAIEGWHVHFNGAIVKRINVQCAPGEIRPLIIKEAIGKIRWTLEKLYSNAARARLGNLEVRVAAPAPQAVADEDLTNASSGAGRVRGGELMCRS